MQVKIRKLNDKAVIPSYAKQGDAGMDLTCTEIVEVNEKGYGYVEYKTGLAFEIPEGHVAILLPRSSVSKTGLIQATSGVIDSGYRGEVTFRFKQVPGTIRHNVGDRVCQMIIIPIPTIEFVESDELSTTARGEGGHGSTGK